MEAEHRETEPIVLVPQNKPVKSNPLVAVASAPIDAWRCGLIGKTLLLGLVILIAANLIAFEVIDNPIADQHVETNHSTTQHIETERIALARIAAHRDIEIARYHSEAEAASHNRRAVFGWVLFGIIVLMFGGMIMSLIGIS